MGSTDRRHRRCDLPINKQKRESIEAELFAIQPLDLRLANLMSVAGFIDYYLRMVGLYPSNRLAYERLEDFHVTLTGKRRYSEYKSFLIVLKRYLHSLPKK